MNEVKPGDFFGSHYQKTTFDGLIVTDTEYTNSKVDWHYHENPYFTYLLQGKLYEANKKAEYYLDPGSLLFHNWQDTHHNIKPPEYTRGFHLELDSQWLAKHHISSSIIEGSIHLKNPLIKNLMNKVLLESKINDSHSELSIEVLVVDIFGRIKEIEVEKTLKKPTWVELLKELILESDVNYTLTELSKELNIHPGHLSRVFHRYFGVTLGQYVRQLKLNKAIDLILSSNLSMTEICYKSGFYDQSHFIQNFKSTYKTTPAKFLKKISGC